MAETVTSSISAGSNDLEKAAHLFAYGGEANGEEVADRASFLKSFLADYYKVAQSQRGQVATFDTEHAHAQLCNTTSCTSTQEGGKSACNTTITTNLASLATEYPSIATVEGLERGNILSDIKEKLMEKLRGHPHPAYAEKLADPVVGSPCIQALSEEFGNASEHLQLFVDNVNDALQQLGAANLTQHELQLLLATAPLPSICSSVGGDYKIERDSDGVSGRQRSNSAAETTSACSGEVDTRTPTRPRRNSSGGERNNRKLLRGVSEGVFKINMSGSQAKRQPLKEVEGEGSVNPHESTKRPNPKQRLSSFLSKRMGSFTNLLDTVELDEESPCTSLNSSTSSTSSNSRRISKTTSFNFGALNRSAEFTPNSRSGSVTPRSGATTPRSGATTPRECDGEDEGLSACEVAMHVAPLKQKLQVVEQALCDEVVQRNQSEQKVAELEEMIFKLKDELLYAQKRIESLDDVNNQMGIELRCLRQKNACSVSERKQVEDSLVLETMKRQALQTEMQMLISKCKEDNVANTEQAEATDLPKQRQQEYILAYQREEVLLQVVESMRVQMEAAEAEMTRARAAWDDERARYQATNDLLRFQLDQVPTKKELPQQSSEFDLRVSEVAARHAARTAPRSALRRRSVSMHELPCVSDLRASLEVPMDSPHETNECEGEGTLGVANENVVTPENVPQTFSSPTITPTSTLPKGTSTKLTTYTQRMKLFFLSSLWWHKIDSMKMQEPTQRSPLLLLQVAWWIAELREYVADQHLNLRLPHTNQFCNCQECVSNAARYATCGKKTFV